MANDCTIACLHCAISKILIERERLGLAITSYEIGKICEVIADIAASLPADDAAQIFALARDFLAEFERSVFDGSWSAGRELVGADGVIRSR